MDKLTLNDILENETLIGNLEAGISAILSNEKNSTSVKASLAVFKKNFVTMIFSGSENDVAINNSIIRVRDFHKYSIEPGYPGSLLSYIINIVRENDFILQNNLMGVFKISTIEKRMNHIIAKITLLLDLTDEGTIKVVEKEGDGKKEAKKEKKEEKEEKKGDDKEEDSDADDAMETEFADTSDKFVQAEKAVWNGATNDANVTQTIKAIFKSSVLSGIFEKPFEEAKKSVSKNFEKLFKFTAQKTISPLDVDQGLDAKNLDKILAAIENTDNLNKKFGISSKISTSTDTTDSGGGKCEKEENIGEVCNAFISFSEPRTIGDMSGIKITNGTGMSHILNGALSVDKSGITVKPTWGLKKKYSIKISTKLNKKTIEILNSATNTTRHIGNEVWHKIEMCHSTILYNVSEKVFKVKLKNEKKDCCIDNIFKIIGYYNGISERQVV